MEFISVTPCPTPFHINEEARRLHRYFSTFSCLTFLCECVGSSSGGEQQVPCLGCSSVGSLSAESPGERQSSVFKWRVVCMISLFGSVFIWSLLRCFSIIDLFGFFSLCLFYTSPSISFYSFLVPLLNYLPFLFLFSLVFFPPSILVLLLLPLFAYILYFLSALFPFPSFFSIKQMPASYSLSSRPTSAPITTPCFLGWCCAWMRRLFCPSSLRAGWRREAISP